MVAPRLNRIEGRLRLEQTLGKGAPQSLMDVLAAPRHGRGGPVFRTVDDGCLDCRVGHPAPHGAVHKLRCLAGEVLNIDPHLHTVVAKAFDHLSRTAPPRAVPPTEEVL